MKRLFLLLFVMLTSQALAGEWRTDVTASGYTPPYFTSVRGIIQFKVTGTRLKRNTLYSIHGQNANIIRQVHTDSNGAITDGQWSDETTGNIGNSCTQAGTPECSNVPIDRWQNGTAIATFADDGTQTHLPCTGGEEITAHRSYYPSNPPPQPSVTMVPHTITYNIQGNEQPHDAGLFLQAIGTPCQPPNTSIHNIKLFKDGVEILSQSVTFNPGDTISFTDSDVQGAPSYNWAIDGQQLGIVTANFGGDPPQNYWQNVTQITVTCDPATPTPTPTPSPSASPPATPPPNSSPPPAGSPPPASTPYPSPNNAGSTNVHVTNASDFYGPIRQAFEDAGSQYTQPNYGSDGFADADLSNRGHLDDLSGKVSEATTKSHDAVNRFKTETDKAKGSFASLPKTMGTVSSIDVGNGAFGYDFNLNLAAWSSQIALLRKLLLWLVTVSFAILSVQALTYQGGD